MPLNNSIQKNSDTFFATSNITANFTSPITTIAIDGVTYDTRLSEVVDNSVSNNSLLMNYWASNTNGSNHNNPMIFLRTKGTYASPADIDANIVNVAQRFYAARIGGVNTVIASERVLATTNNTAILMQKKSRQAASRGGILGLFDVPQTGFATSILTSAVTNMQFVVDRTTELNNFTVTGNISPNSIPQSTANGTNYPAPLFTTPNLTSVPNLSGEPAYTFGTFRYSTAATAEANQLNGILLAKLNSSNPGLTPSFVANNQILGNIDFAGSNDSATRNVFAMARIAGFCDGTMSSNTDLPGRLVFFTCPEGSGTLTESMRIDNAGRITQIRQPSFSASLSADVANATGDGTAYTVAFDTEQYDQGSNFAANTFTAPIAGRYRFAYTISVDDLLVGHTKMEVTVGGQTVCRVNPYAIADSDGFCLLNGSVDLSLAASATVTMVVTVSGSTKTVTVKGTTSSGTFLSGQLQV